LIAKIILPKVPPPGAGFTTATLDVPTVARSGAGTRAVSVDDETKVVARSVPFHCTVESLTKSVPAMINVRLDLPAVVEVGLIDISVGTGFVVSITVKVWLFEVPPPGAGFTTATGNVPVAATSSAGITAVSWVDEAKVVVAATPLKSTTEFETKFVPRTVSVRSGPPARVEVGLIEDNVGTGFAVAVTVNVWLFEVPPPGAGFVTVTGNVPVAATSIAGIMARSVVLEMKVVVAASPLKFTTEPEMKFAPFTVSVKSALPAGIEVGVIETVVGRGFGVTTAATVKVWLFEVPPPGAGFRTATLAVPAVAILELGISAVSVVLEMKVVI